MAALLQHLRRLGEALRPESLFARIPTLRFASDRTECDICGTGLRVRKSRTRSLSTLAMGRVRARESLLYCPACGRSFASKDLLRLAPCRSRYGYDVLVYIGESLFVEHRATGSIQADLRERGIRISLREVAYLARRFILYLSRAHAESRFRLRALLQSRGGYILHLDATVEGCKPSPDERPRRDQRTGT